MFGDSFTFVHPSIPENRYTVTYERDDDGNKCNYRVVRNGQVDVTLMTLPTADDLVSWLTGFTGGF